MSTLADARRWRPMGGGIQSVGWHLTSWIKPAVFKHAGYPQFYLYLFFKKKRSLQNYNMFMCRRNANQLRIPPTLRGEGWQQTHQQPGAGVLLIVWVQRGQLLPASSTLGSFFVSVVSSGTASGSKLSCQLVFLPADSSEAAYLPCRCRVWLCAAFSIVYSKFGRSFAAVLTVGMCLRHWSKAL